jgi:hypothetical protein
MTPYANMNKFDDLIEQAYALKYALEDNGETVLAMQMVSMIGRIVAEQDKAIASWQQDNSIMSNRSKV